MTHLIDRAWVTDDCTYNIHLKAKERRTNIKVSVQAALYEVRKLRHCLTHSPTLALGEIEQELQVLGDATPLVRGTTRSWHLWHCLANCEYFTCQYLLHRLSLCHFSGQATIPPGMFFLPNPIECQKRGTWEASPSQPGLQSSMIAP